MLSQIKTEISLYWVNVLISKVLTAFTAINYFIYGVRIKRFYFLCYFLSFLFYGAANSNPVYGLLVHEVSTSCTTTHYSR